MIKSWFRMGLLLVMSTAIDSSALAADWSGPYIGATTGYMMGSARTTHPGYSSGVYVPPSSSGYSYDSGTADPTGALLGVQAGFIQQHGNFIFGIEADLNWTNVRGHHRTPYHYADGSIRPGVYNTTEVKVDAMYSIEGRMGCQLSDNLIGYVALGGAMAQASYTADVDFEGGTWHYPARVREESIGAVYGVGLEWQLRKQWSAKLDYRHYHLDTVKTGLMPPHDGNGPVAGYPWAYQYTWKNVFDQVKVGVNHRF